MELCRLPAKRKAFMDEKSSSEIKAESKNMEPINELPDDVLRHIVSFLPLKDAVETSMVSHRWNRLCKHLILTRRNLEFDIPNMFGAGKYADLTANLGRNYLMLADRVKRRDFIKRVHEFLRLYSGKKVDSLKVNIYLSGEFAADLDEWIRFAIEKGAQVFEIQLHYDIWGSLNIDKKDHDKLYNFPYQLLPDSSLKHLSLHQCVLKPPSDDFNKFSQLRTLDLRLVILDENFTECLFSNCLFLERLTLSHCEVGSYMRIAAHSSLIDLKVLSCYTLRKLEICAANLVSLEHDCYKLDIFRIETPRLARLFLHEVFGDKYNGLAQFASCPRLESLYLIIDCTAEIPPTISSFRNVKQMSLVQSFSVRDYQIGSLLNILKATPLLEELEIVIPIWSLSNHEDTREYSGFPHNHLRKVQLRGFHGELCEIKLAILILKMAIKLEEMVIDPLGKVYEGDGTNSQNLAFFWDEDKHSFDHSVDEDGVPHLWKRKIRTHLQEKLKVVMTDAQVIIL